VTPRATEAGTKLSADADPTSGLWKRPRRFGYPETLRGLGGIVAPLLTGFSLATIATLVSADDPPPLTDWALIALAATMALLLFSIQVAFLALARNPSPAEILIWRPEVIVDESELHKARVQQRSDFAEMTRFWNLAGPTYDLGVLTFLAAVLLLLISDDWSVPRAVAVGVAGMALMGEAWWALANRRDAIRIPHPVVRKPEPPDVPPLRPLERAALLKSLDHASDGAPRDSARDTAT
jgi:hypothetical protein